MSAAISHTPQPVASFVAGTGVVPEGDLRAKLGVAAKTQAEREADAQMIMNGVPINVGDARELALGMAETGIPLPGIGHLATVASLPLSFWAADEEARAKLSELTDRYRSVIAEKLGVEEEQVSDDMTLGYAEQNPYLRGAIEAIARKRSAHPMSNMAGVGGLLAGGALAGTLVAGPLGLVAGLAAGMAGYEGAKALGDDLLGVKEGTDPHAVLEAISEKHEKGDPVTMLDVLALRIAQQESLQQAIAFHHGKAFHEMGLAERQEVVTHLPVLAQECLQDATLCNQPGAQLQQLMLGRMSANDLRPPAAETQAPTSWVERVGGAPAANENIGFADRVQQTRAAAEIEQAEMTK